MPLSKERRREAYGKLCKLNRRDKEVCKWLWTCDESMSLDDIVEQAVEKFSEKKLKEKVPCKERLQKQHDAKRAKRGLGPEPIKWAKRRHERQ